MNARSDESAPLRDAARSSLALVRAIAIACLMVGCGGSDSGETPQPAAYFIDGLEYQFDYQLDAQGRVQSYRVSQRPGISYPTSAAIDTNVKECTGDLRGSYSCTSNVSAMRGESGRLVESRYGSISNATYYTYEGQVLLGVLRRWTGPGFHDGGETSYGFAYASGRLQRVTEDTRTSTGGACFLSSYSESVTLSGDNRLLRSAAVSTTPPAPAPTCMVMPGGPKANEWTYGQAGYMERLLFEVNDLAGGLISRTTTRYEADGNGWLLRRTVAVETPSATTTESDDAYSITYSAGLVSEERFTQALPDQFYAIRALQRVRYQSDRMPTEPLFVPRAVTGLEAVHHFGVISSHHR